MRSRIYLSRRENLGFARERQPDQSPSCGLVWCGVVWCGRRRLAAVAFTEDGLASTTAESEFRCLAPAGIGMLLYKGPMPIVLSLLARYIELEGDGRLVCVCGVCVCARAARTVTVRNGILDRRDRRGVDLSCV